MIHYIFFICLISLCVSAVSFGFSLLFFIQYRKKVVLYFTMMLTVVIFLVISRMIETYFRIIGISGDNLLIVAILEKVSYLIGVIYGPLFCFNLIGIQLSKNISVIFKSIPVIYAVAAFLDVIATGSPLSTISRTYIGLPLLFGTYIVLCFLAAMKLESLGNPLLNKTLKLFFIVSLLIFPPALIKYLRGVPFLPYHLENSLSLLVVAIVSILFAFNFLNQPSFYKQGKLSDYFRSRFGTTIREEEIIHQALSGKTNVQIADKLCISVRTVESHMYNIFQKTGVKNRVQLLNLIVTNRSE